MYRPRPCTASVPSATATSSEGIVTRHVGDILDVYTGEQIGAGRKSLAYNLIFRADDRTLTAEEAVAAQGRGGGRGGPAAPVPRCGAADPDRVDATGCHCTQNSLPSGSAIT